MSSAYILKIRATLPVSDRDPAAMAAASQLIAQGLPEALRAAGLKDAEITARYVAKVKDV